MTSDFRPEVEIWPFRACAVKIRNISINQPINTKALALNRGQHYTLKYKYRVYKIANKAE